jgi:hypothetical protein
VCEIPDSAGMRFENLYKIFSAIAAGSRNFARESEALRQPLDYSCRKGTQKIYFKQEKAGE